MLDYTKIIVAILSLIYVIVMSFFVPWLKEKCSYEKLKRISTLVRIGVQAAEQLYGSGMGQAKLDYVFTYLDKQGIKFDKDYVYSEVRGMIESAVLEVNNSVENGGEK